MANWATEADVLAYTGATVTDAQISLAQGVLDVISGVTDAARANLTARDLLLLKQACAYQTVWMVNQVDVFTRTDVTAVRQDTVEYDPAHPDAFVLAPLARRCLDRLSWRRSRSLNVSAPCDPRFGTLEAYERAWLRDEHDRATDWRPL